VLGSGAQWVAWIHIDDLLELILFVLEQQTLAGPLNATAPTPVRHAELMRAIATLFHRRLLPFAIPAFVLRRVLGELAELFVDGQRVVRERASALGFRFRYATIDEALADIYSRRPDRRTAAVAS
jgi:NAD dependent epimerase/dehydratase family enzyme